MKPINKSSQINKYLYNYNVAFKYKIISLGELLGMDEYERAEHLLYKAIKLGKRLDPEYEEMIKLSPIHIYFYAKDVIKGRWLEGEEYIKKDSEYAYWYARDIIKNRWLEAEPYILKNPVWTYWYIYEIIKDRWLEAEETIMKYPESAYWYAKDFIKGRWEEAEEYIKKDNYWWRRYCNHFRIKS